jgi:transposase
MRQTHLAGEKLFVDWAGDTMPVFDPTTGEAHRVRRECQKFCVRRPL